MMHKNAIPFRKKLFASFAVPVPGRLTISPKPCIIKKIVCSLSGTRQGGLNTIVVLGIDPGYALMGWGVVESEGSRMKLLGYGCVETKAGVPMQLSLIHI